MDWERMSPNRGFNTSRYYAYMPDVTYLLRRLEHVDVGSLVLGMAASMVLVVVGIVCAYLLVSASRPYSARLRHYLPARIMPFSLSKGTAALGRYAYSRLSGEMVEKEAGEEDLPQ